MLNRAYALLEIKSVDVALRRVTGIAATPTPDRSGDIFEPRGATFASEIPLLLHHDKQRPVGTARLMEVDGALLFEATLAQVATPGPLRDRLEETFQMLQAGLLKGVSVGFRALKDGAKVLRDGGLHFLKTEICELSLVTVPANVDATVLSVKSADQPYLETPTMSTAEQIAALETRRAAHVARMTALLESPDRLTDEQTKEYDTLDADVRDADVKLPRLKEFEKSQMAAALPVPQAPLGSRTQIIRVKSNAEPGIGFVRYCKAWAASRGDTYQAIKFAADNATWRDQTPEVELLLRAATGPASTVTVPWAGALVPTLQHLGQEFIALLRPATVIGRIPGLRKVPFDVQVPKQTGGGVYRWVGEGAPKPVGQLVFTTVALPHYKIAGILTFTVELARNSSPDAEATFRDEMIAGISQYMDAQFLDPTVALVTGVNPASITNGVTGIPATADPWTDIAAMLNTFVAANISLGGVVLIMSEANAFTLASKRRANGDPVFPTLSISGGSINGVSVITSQAAGTNIIGAVPRLILYADDGGVQVDVSREASLQMNDAPGAPDATTVFRSLWQDNLVGLRAERFTAWIKAHANAVNMVTGTAYTPTMTEVVTE